MVGIEARLHARLAELAIEDPAATGCTAPVALDLVDRFSQMHPVEKAEILRFTDNSADSSVAF